MKDLFARSICFALICITRHAYDFLLLHSINITILFFSPLNLMPVKRNSFLYYCTVNCSEVALFDSEILTFYSEPREVVCEQADTLISGGPILSSKHADTNALQTLTSDNEMNCISRRTFRLASRFTSVIRKFGGLISARVIRKTRDTTNGRSGGASELSCLLMYSCRY